VRSGDVYKMVMSIGFNPQFHNEMKTMEAHIIHEYAEDFYGQLLKVIVLGYIRPMQTFKNLDELKNAIRTDIQIAKDLLELPENIKFSKHPFLDSETPGADTKNSIHPSNI